MSAPAVVGVDRPTLRIRGTAYPVLLPTLRDPRLHLAGVIVSLQVLGQVAFDFQLSIAQILVSLAVAGILEVAIAFRSQRVLMWPASALLTGNGVAFVLRVPGTEHGDWWSMNGWWIFAGTSAIALLSKYLIKVRGRHIFNPSNFGLVLCFLLLGAERADPLALWWGPLSPALVFAIGLIVAGGFLILRRLHLVGIAVGFWLAFAAGIGVLAASGHTMTAAWHVGPIEGAEFWWLLVSSPEILVFLFFMITDPKTTPVSRGGRRVYAVGVGLLATLLIAPQTTEFGTKVAILAALALACATRGAIELVGSERLTRSGAPTAETGNRRRHRAGGRGRLRRTRRRGRSTGAPRGRIRGRRRRRPGSPRGHRRGHGGNRGDRRRHRADDRPRRRRRPSRRVGIPPARRRRHGGDGCERRVARNALEPDRATRRVRSPSRPTTSTRCGSTSAEARAKARPSSWRSSRAPGPPRPSGAQAPRP